MSSSEIHKHKNKHYKGDRGHRGYQGVTGSTGIQGPSGTIANDFSIILIKLHNSSLLTPVFQPLTGSVGNWVLSYQTNNLKSIGSINIRTSGSTNIDLLLTTGNSIAELYVSALGVNNLLGPYFGVSDLSPVVTLQFGSDYGSSVGNGMPINLYIKWS